MKKIYEAGVDQFTNIKQFDENGDCFIDVDRRYKFRIGANWLYGEIHSYNRPRNQKDGLVNNVCVITDKHGESCSFCIGVLPSDIYFSDIEEDNIVTPEVVTESLFESVSYFMPDAVSFEDYYKSNGYNRLFYPPWPEKI